MGSLIDDNVYDVVRDTVGITSVIFIAAAGKVIKRIKLNDHRMPSWMRWQNMSRQYH